MIATSQAVILVGGKGTRLGGLTASTPKPLMLMSDGRPFLDHLIESVARQGVARILLLAGHFGDQITQRYGQQIVGGARVSVIVEPEPAGTAGALRIAAQALDETFYLMNGDSIVDINLRSLDLAAAGALNAMAVRAVDNASRYGSVTINAANLVVRFEEKRLDLDDRPGLINAGVYLLRREVINLIDRTPMSIESDVFPLLAKGGAIIAVPTKGYFIDIGLPDTLERAAIEVPRLAFRPLMLVILADLAEGDEPVDLVTWSRADDIYEAVRLADDGGWRVVLLIAGPNAEVSHATRCRLVAELAAQGGFAEIMACPGDPAVMIASLLGDEKTDRVRSLIVDATGRPASSPTDSLEAMRFGGGSMRPLIDTICDARK
jgi:D-glycero-D-manno-heptose 1,7-bisphosphate phosphatase